MKQAKAKFEVTMEMVAALDAAMAAREAYETALRELENACGFDISDEDFNGIEGKDAEAILYLWERSQEGD